MNTSSTCLYSEDTVSFDNSSHIDSFCDSNSRDASLCSSLSSLRTSSTCLYSEDTDSIEDSSPDGLRFYYTNADNLLNKFDEFELLMNTQDIDIAVITEVFPKNIKATNIDSQEYCLKGYQCFHSNLKENSRGVVIFIRNDIPADYCCNLTNSAFSESVWAELRLSDGKKLLLGGIYKSPSSNVDNHRKLNLLLTRASNLQYDHLIVLGDFNFPEIDWSTWTVNRNEAHPAFLFIECLRDNFLSQSVNECTRYRDGQDPSCLDLLLSDNQTDVENLKFLGRLGASDHVGVSFDFACEVSINSENIDRPKYFKGNYVEIRDYLGNIAWNQMENMGVEESWKFLLDHLNTCIDRFIPRSTVNKKGFQKPRWMDYYCVRKIKKKYHAWKRFTHSHSYRDYQAYCKLRNSATKAIRFSKKKYQKGVAESSKTSPKSFWSFIKDETKGKSEIGDLIDEDGNRVTENVDKANMLNDFFASVFTREGTGDLPDFNDKIEEDEFINDINILPDCVLKQLRNLNVSKACGPDGCHPYFLKQCAEQLYRPLSVIFNKSIQSGVLPNDWKVANISSLFKKGSKTDPGNYRPVSLTSVVCKILEKIIREVIVNHLSSHNLLSDCQFGFMKHRSTITQLLSVLEDWTEAFEHNMQVDTVYLDFRKAFDSVPHKRLLQKVKSYGISGQILKWLQNFLDGRRQRVVLNGRQSEWKQVLSGVPQGSILGPILFIIFINDLPEVVGSMCKIFADDCKLYGSISSRADQDQLQEDINRLCQWSDDWLLKFNVRKCKVVTFGTQKFEFDYTMIEDGIAQELNREDSEKDLGVHFSSTLNFEQHINNTVNKVNKIIGLIRRKFTYMDKNLFLTLYKSLIRSQLDYGNLIYFPTTKKCKQLVENAQRRATRLVPELRGMTYEERLRELNLSTLDYRRKRFDIIQVYKIVHKIDNVDMNTFFKFADNSGTRGHNLKLYKPKAKKSIRLNSFGHRTISTWNNLPESIVNCTSVISFKTNLDKLWRDKRYDMSEVY